MQSRLTMARAVFDKQDTWPSLLTTFHIIQSCISFVYTAVHTDVEQLSCKKTTNMRTCSIEDSSQCKGMISEV